MHKQFTIKEASEKMMISTTSLNKWLRNHPQFANNSANCIISNPKSKKPKRTLTEKGLVILMNAKSLTNPRLDEKARLALLQGKQNIVEKAMGENNQKFTISLYEYNKLNDMMANYNQLAEKVIELENKMNVKQIEQHKQFDISDSLSEPTVSVPDLTRRDELLLLVKSYTVKHKYDYKLVWDYLYSQFNARYHINLKTRKKEEDETYLDVAERIGMLDELYAVAVLLYKGK